MWKDVFESGKDVIIATTSKVGKPHAIYVTSLGFFDGKLLIGACQMRTTLDNLKDNKLISVVGNQGNGYFRIDGEVTIYSSGKYFDKAMDITKELLGKYLPKFVIVVKTNEVFDLDKAKIIL